MEDCIVTDLRDRVLTLTLNNPAQRNAWNPQMELALRAALLAADADPQVRVIVLTGAGRTFCPGVAPTGLGKSTPVAPPDSDEDLGQRYSYMLGLRKPLIAAINGAAAGVGFCLTLYCDLRFMVDSAKLTTAFVRRGLVAEHGSAWMLPRLIGPMNAADLLLSGRVVTGAEAAALGLVRALPESGFAEAVHAYAVDMAQNAAPRALAVIKSQLAAGYRQSLAEATRTSNRETAIALGTPDLAEGFASLAERRAPRFSDLI